MNSGRAVVAPIVTVRPIGQVVMETPIVRMSDSFTIFPLVR
jgi:hypothetical protein